MSAPQMPVQHVLSRPDGYTAAVITRAEDEPAFVLGFRALMDENLDALVESLAAVLYHHYEPLTPELASEIIASTVIASVTAELEREAARMDGEVMRGEEGAAEHLELCRRLVLQTVVRAGAESAVSR